MNGMASQSQPEYGHVLAACRDVMDWNRRALPLSYGTAWALAVEVYAGRLRRRAVDGDPAARALLAATQWGDDLPPTCLVSHPSLSSFLHDVTVQAVLSARDPLCVRAGNLLRQHCNDDVARTGSHVVGWDGLLAAYLTFARSHKASVVSVDPGAPCMDECAVYVHDRVVKFPSRVSWAAFAANRTLWTAACKLEADGDHSGTTPSTPTRTPSQQQPVKPGKAVKSDKVFKTVKAVTTSNAEKGASWAKSRVGDTSSQVTPVSQVPPFIFAAHMSSDA